MPQEKGFTLLEVMLVIAIVAVMAVLSVMTYHRHARSEQIDRVALEVQQLLGAAVVFNVDQRRWPNPHNEADCEMAPPPPSSLFVANYLPNQSAHNSYGSFFCWSSAGRSHQEGARLFWVALRVPNNNLQFAKQIAARLPNAILTSDPNEVQIVPCGDDACYVRTEVVEPVSTNNRAINRLMIIATGDCPSHNNTGNSNADSSRCTSVDTVNGSKYRITFNACPDQDLPRVTVFPNFVSFPKLDSWPGYTVKNIRAERTNEACTSTVGSGAKKKQNCDVVVHATICVESRPHHCSDRDAAESEPPGSIGASYVVACVPPIT